MMDDEEVRSDSPLDDLPFSLEGLRGLTQIPNDNFTLECSPTPLYVHSPLFSDIEDEVICPSLESESPTKSPKVCEDLSPATPLDGLNEITFTPVKKKRRNLAKRKLCDYLNDEPKTNKKIKYDELLEESPLAELLPQCSKDVSYEGSPLAEPLPHCSKDVKSHEELNRERNYLKRQSDEILRSETPVKRVRFELESDQLRISQSVPDSSENQNKDDEMVGEGASLEEELIQVISSSSAFSNKHRVETKFMTLKFREIREGENVMDYIREGFEGILSFIRDGEIQPFDRVGLTIYSSNNPDQKPIGISLRRADQMNADVIMKTVEAVLQSNESFFIDGPLQVRKF